MKIRLKTICLFLTAALILPPAGFGAIEAVPGSSEDLYFTRPATVHSYKKLTDLHSIVAGTMALSEIEFVRAIDYVLSLPVPGRYYPFETTFDFVHDSYGKIPHLKPVRRVGQLFTGLQIRQLSLSDVKIGSSIYSGQTGSGITPMMQVRLNKLIILVEDLVNDVDLLVMYPVNKTVSHFRKKDVRIESVNYAGRTLGVVRRGLFAGLRAVNKFLTKTGSQALTGVEGARNYFKRRRLRKKNNDYIIYIKMPLSKYLKYRRYFEKDDKWVYTAGLARWKLLRQENVRTADLFKRDAENLSLTDLNPEQPVVTAIEMRSWRDAPAELYPYVIQPDEFEHFLK